tara:strand:+ start:244 stop:660 length:417 start_codon:yes stop_codon:yes gene_type:complete
MASSRDAKIAKVMGEFKRGTLKSSSGKKVTNRKQALAIANSEGDRVMPQGKGTYGSTRGRPPKKAMSKGGPAKKKSGGSAKKKQGFNARLDESLGSRNKAKGKLGARRRESEGMEKKLGRRKFAAVKTMDKGRRKRKA